MTDPRDLPYCFPPHPSPRKPSYQLPENAVDTHFHIFGPPEVFPWSPPEQRIYTPPAAPLAHYRMLAKHLGIDRGVVVQPMAHGFDNSVTLDAIARSGGNMMGVAKVNQQTPDEELQRLHEGGIRGARFNLRVREGGSAEKAGIESVLGRIGKLGWSVTFHVAATELEPDWYAGMNLPVIIDHYARVNFGDGVEQPAFQTLLRLFRDCSHIFVKISCIERCSAVGPPYEDSLPFAHALLEIAPERLLWGTDWPNSQRYELGQQCDTGELVDMVPKLIPDAGLRKLILVDNPLKLFPFDQTGSSADTVSNAGVESQVHWPPDGG